MEEPLQTYALPYLSSGNYICFRTVEEDVFMQVDRNNSTSIYTFYIGTYTLERVADYGPAQGEDERQGCKVRDCVSCWSRRPHHCKSYTEEEPTYATLGRYAQVLVMLVCGIGLV